MLTRLRVHEHSATHHPASLSPNGSVFFTPTPPLHSRKQTGYIRQFSKTSSFTRSWSSVAAVASILRTTGDSVFLVHQQTMRFSSFTVSCCSFVKREFTFLFAAVCTIIRPSDG